MIYNVKINVDFMLIFCINININFVLIYVILFFYSLLKFIENNL